MINPPAAAAANAHTSYHYLQYVELRSVQLQQDHLTMPKSTSTSVEAGTVNRKVQRMGKRKEEREERR
jgi:hypothetical protein